MVNLTTYELWLIAGKRSIKNYQNMSREKLLSTLDESEGILENLSQNGLQRIAKMQNLSENELEQIAKMRRIKNYKNMSKEELLIALLKSKQSHAELYKSKSNNAEIEETKKIFNELRNKFSKSKIKEIRKKLYEKEKGLENEEKKVKKYQEEQEKKQHAKELKKIKKSLEKLQENFEKYHNKDDQDYKGIRYIENLFNKIDEDYHKSIKTKGAFNNNYKEYESRGDKYKNLSLEDYLNIIRLFLRDTINNHKTHGEWKIQLTIMDSKSDNVEIMMGIETDDILNEPLNLFLKSIKKD